MWVLTPERRHVRAKARLVLATPWLSKKNLSLSQRDTFWTIPTAYGLVEESGDAEWRHFVTSFLAKTIYYFLDSHYRLTL